MWWVCVLGGASGGGEGHWRDSILGIELEVAALERKNRKEDSVLGAHGKEKEGAWIAGQGERRWGQARNWQDSLVGFCKDLWFGFSSRILRPGCLDGPYWGIFRPGSLRSLNPGIPLDAAGEPCLCQGHTLGGSYDCHTRWACFSRGSYVVW